jgi:hypothetical protein
MNPKTEVQKTCDRGRIAGARRSRRFIVGLVWCVFEPLARWTLKRPEGRAPCAWRDLTSVFGMKATRLTFSLFAALSLVCLAFWTTRAADRPWKLPPETAKFKPAPGLGAALATTHCLLCHSADYISTQPPLDRAGWAASVTKMREKYGAPLPTNQVEVLVDYFVKTYGKERPK